MMQRNKTENHHHMIILISASLETDFISWHIYTISRQQQIYVQWKVYSIAVIIFNDDLLKCKKTCDSKQRLFSSLKHAHTHEMKTNLITLTVLCSRHATHELPIEDRLIECLVIYMCDTNLLRWLNSGYNWIAFYAVSEIINAIILHIQREFTFSKIFIRRRREKKNRL